MAGGQAGDVLMKKVGPNTFQPLSPDTLIDLVDNTQEFKINEVRILS